MPSSSPSLQAMVAARLVVLSIPLQLLSVQGKFQHMVPVVFPRHSISLICHVGRIIMPRICYHFGPTLKRLPAFSNKWEEVTTAADSTRGQILQSPSFPVCPTDRSTRQSQSFKHMIGRQYQLIDCHGLLRGPQSQHRSVEITLKICQKESTFSSLSTRGGGHLNIPDWKRRERAGGIRRHFSIPVFSMNLFMF